MIVAYNCGNCAFETMNAAVASLSDLFCNPPVAFNCDEIKYISGTCTINLSKCTIATRLYYIYIFLLCRIPPSTQCFYLQKKKNINHPPGMWRPLTRSKKTLKAWWKSRNCWQISFSNFFLLNKQQSLAGDASDTERSSLMSCSMFYYNKSFEFYLVGWLVGKKQHSLPDSVVYALE